MPSIKGLLITLALLTPLAGCKTVPEVKAPEKVYITVEKLPVLTPEQRKLLEDCPITEPTNDSVDMLYTVARARKAELKGCNIDKKGIRGWWGIE
jgi:hypothetical protein